MALGEAMSYIIALLQDADSRVRCVGTKTILKLSAQREIPIVHHIKLADNHFQAEYRVAIEQAIPQILSLLRDNDSGVRIAAVDLLPELSKRSEISSICYRGSADAFLKLNFGQQLERPFRKLLLIFRLAT